MTPGVRTVLADTLRKHDGPFISKNDLSECECGWEGKDSSDSYFGHLADVVLTLDGMAAEYGIHDLTQQGTADVEMWWTDDPAEGFVARDAAVGGRRMTDIIERAEAALDLWDNTIGVEIEIISGMDAAKDAYENAPEMVRDLVAELKVLRREIGL